MLPQTAPPPGHLEVDRVYEPDDDRLRALLRLLLREAAPDSAAIKLQLATENGISNGGSE